ncbi:MAG: SCO family protein [Bradyrhizobium sp.]|nr:SCO family protein [Pseudomonadota bacterium]MDE2066880.1 SCO family protein [Bradyrhizobium sp.]MDE2470987.1 SCO family protein [Bradyrhizobium sp.]
MIGRGFIPLLVLVTAAGIGALAWETEGFNVVTVNGARQLDIARRPRSLPDVPLMDQDGQLFSLADYKGDPVFVDFIYTRCPTICRPMGDQFQHVLQWQDSHPEQKVKLVSISFDLENDGREALRRYGDRYGARAPQWRIAAPLEQSGLDALRRAFGLIVIPDGTGGFIHNGDVYLIDARGRLTRAFDPDAAPPVFISALTGIRS